MQPKRESTLTKPNEMSSGQRAYETKRAAKAGMNLEKWLAAKERDRLALAAGSCGLFIPA